MYFITITTFQRQAVFVFDAVVSHHLDVLDRVAVKHAFEVPAYCYMPDHLHLLLEAKAKTSDLLAIVGQYKQKTGYQYKQQTGRFLWQKSFYDHVVRRDESVHEVVGYILANPVRRQLAERPGDYPYAGSMAYGRAVFDNG